MPLSQLALVDFVAAKLRRWFKLLVHFVTQILHSVTEVVRRRFLLRERARTRKFYREQLSKWRRSEFISADNRDLYKKQFVFMRHHVNKMERVIDATFNYAFIFGYSFINLYLAITTYIGVWFPEKFISLHDTYFNLLPTSIFQPTEYILLVVESVYTFINTFLSLFIVIMLYFYSNSSGKCCIISAFCQASLCYLLGILDYNFPKYWCDVCIAVSN